MISKRLEALSFADVESLVASGTREGRSLEFKRDLVIGKDEDRREFLADVSAMANSYGGDIVFGVDAPTGVASAAPGIELLDVDAEQLRLHQILQAGLEPRLSHVEMRWLLKAGNRGALIIRTRPSLSGPHRVTLRDHAKFYGRHGAGKFSMDTFQLRAAFAASEGVPERIRTFHQQQVGRAADDDHVLPLHAGPFAALHFVPLSSLTAPVELRFGPNDYVAPPRTTGVSWMPAFEGVVTYSGPEDTPVKGVRTFTLMQRDGTLEMFATVGSSTGPQGVHPGTLESTLTDYVGTACGAAATFAIDGPFVLAFSLARMQGVTLRLGHDYSARPLPCRRSILTFPTLLLDDPKIEELALLPIKELMWNAFGVARPPSFSPR